MTTNRCKTGFVAHKKTKPLLSNEEADEQLLNAVADLAWWFGWGVQDVYALPLDEFEDWQKEAARQIKAGYGRIGGI